MALSEFLLARIAEDEYDANHATRWPWDAYADGKVLGVGQNRVAENVPSWNGPHIARHDPARVLAECEAKRRIVELLGIAEQHFDDVRRTAPEYALVAAAEQPRNALLLAVQTLAAVYSDHPDYRQEWKP